MRPYSGVKPRLINRFQSGLRDTVRGKSLAISLDRAVGRGFLYYRGRQGCDVSRDIRIIL